MEEGADYRSVASSASAECVDLPGIPGVPDMAGQIPDDCSGLRFDAALAKMFPAHSRSRLQGWIKAGRFLLDGAQCDAKRKVLGGETLVWVNPAKTEQDADAHAHAHVGGDEYDPEGLDDLAVPQRLTFPQAENIPLNIVFEDDQILVINKPAGLVVHPGNGNSRGTLLNGLLYHCAALAEIPRAGIVHRLDKETSGLLVVAKTLTAQTDLVRQLQARTVKRHYLALALGILEYGATVDAAIGRHPTQRTRMAVTRGGREARTHFKVREPFDKCTLIECQLETGRTHQIRVHLAHIGHPLAGDPVYGKTCSRDARLDAFKRQALHAWRLALIHPQTHEEVAWEAPLPDDFAQLLDSLRALGDED